MRWTNATFHRIAQAMGVDYRRYNARNFVHLRRAANMATLAISKVLDVGAHDGGYGRELRRQGFNGEIVSFEPLAQPFERLEQLARRDGKWRAVHCALGSTKGEATINVSGRPTSSSFLAMTVAHEKASPGSHYQGSERVRVERLDDHLLLTDIERGSVWLKIDVQGYEKQVMDGAGDLLEKFAGIELEMSLAPTYQNSPLIEDVITELRTRGFTPTSFEDVLFDRETSRVLQVNGIFLRNCDW